MSVRETQHRFLQSFAGNAIYALTNWGMLSVIAKMSNEKSVGQFALSLVIAQPIFVLTSFNLGGVLMSDVRREFRFIDYLFFRLFTSGAGILLLMLVCGAGRYELETRWVILLNGLGIAVDSLSQLIYGLLSLHRQVDRVALSLSSKGILSLMGVAVGLALTHSLVWASAGSLLASILVVALYDLPNGVRILQVTPSRRLFISGVWFKAEARFPWNGDALRRLAILAAPMGVTVTLITLTTSIPRLALEHYLGTKQLGLFSAQASLVTIGRMASLALDQASRPQLAHHYANGERDAFTRLLRRLLFSGAALSVGLLLAALAGGHLFLAVFFAPEYAKDLSVLLISLAASGMSYLANCCFNALSAARQFAVQAPCMLMVVAVTLLASALFIPLYGVRGAALAGFAGMTAQLAAGVFLIRRVIQTAPEKTGVQEASAPAR